MDHLLRGTLPGITNLLRGGNGEEEGILGLTQAAPGDDGPGIAGGDALQHRGLVHRQRQVLRSDENHGVLVNCGVGACKESITVRRHPQGLGTSSLIERSHRGLHPSSRYQ